MVVITGVIIIITWSNNHIIRSYNYITRGNNHITRGNNHITRGNRTFFDIKIMKINSFLLRNT